MFDYLRCMIILHFLSCIALFGVECPTGVAVAVLRERLVCGVWVRLWSLGLQVTGYGPQVMIDGFRVKG